MHHRYLDLWPENKEAWSVWSRIASRTVVELTLVPWVFERVVTGDTDAQLDMLQRIEAIREIIDPPDDHGPRPQDQHRRR